MNVFFEEEVASAFNVLRYLFSVDCLGHEDDFTSYPIELKKEVDEYWKRKAIYSCSYNRHDARRYKFALLDLRQKALNYVLEQENVFGIIEEEQEEALMLAFLKGVKDGI